MKNILAAFTGIIFAASMLTAANASEHKIYKHHDDHYEREYKNGGHNRYERHEIRHERHHDEYKRYHGKKDDNERYERHGNNHHERRYKRHEHDVVFLHRSSR